MRDDDDDLWVDGPDEILNVGRGKPHLEKPRHTGRHDDDDRHIGCPVWWLRLVFPIVRGKGELAAALYLFRLRAIRKSKTVSVPNGWLREHGIRRQAKYQMLNDLARARIIRVGRDGKNALRVTFLNRR